MIIPYLCIPIILESILCIPIIRGCIFRSTANLQFLRWNFMGAGLFLYEDSKIMSVRLSGSVCPYPEKRNYPSFINSSPTVVNYCYMNGKVFISNTTWKPKNLIFKKEWKWILTCYTLVFHSSPNSYIE